jgi:hypothetical protein
VSSTRPRSCTIEIHADSRCPRHDLGAAGFKQPARLCGQHAGTQQIVNQDDLLARHRLQKLSEAHGHVAAAFLGPIYLAGVQPSQSP